MQAKFLDKSSSEWYQNILYVHFQYKNNECDNLSTNSTLNTGI